MAPISSRLGLYRQAELLIASGAPDAACRLYDAAARALAARIEQLGPEPTPQRAPLEHRLADLRARIARLKAAA